MNNCPNRNRMDAQATSACLNCKYCLPPGLRKDGNMCSLDKKDNKKISKFTRVMAIYIIVMLMLLCAFQTYYIHKLEKQIDDRDRIIHILTHDKLTRDKTAEIKFYEKD